MSRLLLGIPSGLEAVNKTGMHIERDEGKAVKKESRSGTFTTCCWR